MAKSVKVRIAVAVDCNGSWNCAGGDYMEEKDLQGCVCDGLEFGERHYWLEAELEVPEPLKPPEVPTVSAKVCEADNSTKIPESGKQLSANAEAIWLAAHKARDDTRDSYRASAASVLRAAADNLAECHYLQPNGKQRVIPVDYLLRIVSELEANGKYGP